MIVIFLIKFGIFYVEIFEGEEPPESLFMKELKRRGMTPGSLLEKDIAEAEEGTDSKAGSTGPTSGLEFEKGISDQRKRSMALNSEGLEVYAIILNFQVEFVFIYMSVLVSHNFMNQYWYATSGYRLTG